MRYNEIINYEINDASRNREMYFDHREMYYDY